MRFRWWWTVWMVALVVVLAGCDNMFVDRGDFESLEAEEEYLTAQVTSWVEEALDPQKGIRIVLHPGRCSSTTIVSTGVEGIVAVPDGQEAGTRLGSWLVDNDVATDLRVSEGTIPTTTALHVKIEGKSWLIVGLGEEVSIQGGTGCYDE